MTGAKERVKASLVRAIVEREFAPAVYATLGGTPLESVPSRPSLNDLLEQSAHMSSVVTEQRAWVRTQLDARRRNVAEMNMRNKARWPLLHLMKHVARYLALERRGAVPDFDAFIRARGPRDALDAVAGSLGVTREQMWERLCCAITEAKSTEAWERCQVLLKQLEDLDWTRVEQAEAERVAKYPQDGKRWLEPDDQALAHKFGELWDAGLEPPTGTLESPPHESPLLVQLSEEFGRTPGAIWQRLVRLGLLSAIPAKNAQAIADRRGSRRA